MAKAEQNSKALETLVIEQFRRWDFPATEAEVQAVAEIDELPAFEVERYTAQIIKQMGTVPNQCHANAQLVVSDNPERKLRQISGYLLANGNYVMHSVVKQNGRMFCVAPLPSEGPDRFTFIPDPDIEWRDESGGSRVAYRKGLVIRVGFRRDPAEAKRILDIVLARIEAGMHPLQAGEPPF